MIELRKVNAKILLILSSFCAISHALKDGDPCTVGSKSGICTPFIKCKSAINALRNRETITHCDKPIRLACCIEDAGTQGSTDGSTCPPFESGQVKATKTNSKAWNKCIDFAEHIYHCENTPVTSLYEKRTKTRVNRCSHDSKPFIIGGTEAQLNEFPHMASLGFESDQGISWDCGGSLISERWVLTAAHCTFNMGTMTNVTQARFGSKNLNEPAEKHLLYNITKIEVHPDYNNVVRYNDIALLKLDRPVVTSVEIIPACLHIGNHINDDKVIAIGYGEYTRDRVRSDVLMKVTLEKFSHYECNRKYRKQRKTLPNGINSESQFCAGHRNESKDTCNGDSGGPIQIKNEDAVACSYLIVGVTANGKGCGIIGLPGVYTKVSHYIKWIEDIVWP